MDSDSHTSPRLQRRLAGTAIVLGIITTVIGVTSYLIPPTPATSVVEWAISHDWSLILFNVAGLLILDDAQDPPDNILFRLARVLAVLTAGFGIAFVVVSLSREGADRLRLRYMGWRARRGRQRHTVICGLGRVGRQLVNDLRGKRSPVVVIEVDAGNPAIERCREQGAAVIIGDARDPGVRQRARVVHAEHVFVVAGDDAVNLDITEDIRSDLVESASANGIAGHTPQIRCYTNISSHTLAQAADRCEPEDSGQFHIFNSDETAARHLLLNDEWGLARAPAGRSRPTSVPREDEVAHYIVFGFGSMGQTVALQMARLAHFRNLKRLRLTVVDCFADPVVRDARTQFIDRHPGFCPVDLDLVEHVHRHADADDWACRAARPAHGGWRSDHEEAVEYAVNAEFLDLESGVDAPALLQKLADRIQLKHRARPVVAIVVCFEDERRSFEAALRLNAALRSLYADERIDQAVPIYVYLPDENGLRDFIDRKQETRRFPLFPFGRRESIASSDLITRLELRRMARVIHEDYESEAEVDRRIPFHQLEPDLKASNEDAAAHGDIKLDAVGWTRATPDSGDASVSAPPLLTKDDIECLAKIEHNRWLGERLSSGWRYGEPGRTENHRRTAFVAWEYLLDARERAKDERHVRRLAAIYAELGQVIGLRDPAQSER